MALREDFQSQGSWLFRWRSYLPVVLVTLIALAFTRLDWPWHSYRIHEIVEFVSLGISFLGLLIRVATAGYAPARTSGRNTRQQIAADLNTTGMYSMVRHPLYLGNYLIGLGIALVLFVWWLPVIYSLAFWLYYERIMYAEEEFLRGQFGNTFDEWARTRPAFWPRIALWRRPTLPFSWRSVLRREYTALMVIVLGHTGIEFFEHVAIDHRLKWEPFWIVFSIGGTAAYFVLRALKKHTNLLDVPGR
jgi:protein-S-isoprenylcysteine O-methyltransferase Ste14